jgi:hypothetical protein
MSLAKPVVIIRGITPRRKTLSLWGCLRKVFWWAVLLFWVWFTADVIMEEVYGL